MHPPSLLLGVIVGGLLTSAVAYYHYRRLKLHTPSKLTTRLIGQPSSYRLLPGDFKPTRYPLGCCSWIRECDVTARLTEGYHFYPLEGATRGYRETEINGFIAREYLMINAQGRRLGLAPTLKGVGYESVA